MILFSLIFEMVSQDEIEKGSDVYYGVQTSLFRV